jgi:PiT family inorganic phosphate transporter
MEFTLLLVIIFLALVFDYINGFHDAANSIATIVATKVLTPFQAVLWAAIFNFLAYWVFGFPISYYLGKFTELKAVGVWIGLLAGLTFAALFLYLRFNYLTNRLNRKSENNCTTPNF